MNESELSDLPTRFFGGQDRLRGQLPTQLCDEGYVAEIVGFPAMSLAEHGRFGHAFYEAFRGLHHTVDECFASGDRIACRFTLRGTHVAEFMGVPASGNEIEVQAFVWLTVRNGRVIRLQAVFDQLGLLRQIGALPA
jgi:steroid delta-isomerase-like uncharacterized protein